MTVVESTARFAQGAPPRRQRRRRLLVVLLVVLLLTAAGWVVWWSPLLSVREVRVLGVSTVSADQVRAAAAVPLGTPLARVGGAAVEQRVTAALPVVRSVEVRDGWPNVLVLVVTERTPVAVARQGGQWTLVDRDAVGYAPVPRPPAGLPTVSADGPALGAAVAVIGALPPGLRARVDTVVAGSPDDVVLTLADRTRVRWGSSDDSARKAAVLLALLPQHARVIDVSAPDLPTTRGATPSSG